MLLYSFNKATLQEEPRAPRLSGAHLERLHLSLHPGHFSCSFLLNLTVLNVFVGIKGIHCVYADHLGKITKCPPTTFR